MKYVAVPVPNGVAVESSYYAFGSHWLTISVGVNNYEGFESSPVGLTFDGRTYGRTGWNSDNGRVYYSTGMKFAIHS